MPQLVAAAAIAISGSTAAVAATATTAAIAGTGLGTIAFAGLSYATLVGYAVTIGGSIAYGQSQASRLRNSMKNLGDQGRSVMVRDPVAMQRLIYGQVPVSGTVVNMAVSGTKGEDLHMIVVMAGHEVAELGTIYFDDFEEVPLDGSGNATGKYAGHVVVRKHLGSNEQTVDSGLVTDMPGEWTTNHRLRGLAYLYIKLTYTPDLFPNGTPTVLCMVKGKKVLDPRVGIDVRTCSIVAGNTNVTVSNVGLSVGMTVVGSGIPVGSKITTLGGATVSIDADPFATNSAVSLAFGTASWSDNSALCTADYLTDNKFGRGVSWSRIDRTGLEDEADICEQTVVLADASTEERYTCNGTILADQDARADLTASMAGRITETGGIWSIQAGAYRAVTAATFTDDMLVGPFVVQTRQSMRDTYNGVKGTYIAEVNNWTVADFPAITNTTYTTQDGSIRRWKEVAYPFTTSHARAQRLAKIDLERGRQQIIVNTTYRLDAFQLAVGDTVALTRAALGWTAKQFEVLNWRFKLQDDMSLAVSVTLKETAEAVWDWADGEETTVDLAPNTTLPDPSVVPTAATPTLLSDGTTVIISDDGTAAPRLKVSWTTPNNIYVEQGGYTEVEYKLTSSGTWLVWSSEVPGDNLIEYISEVVGGLAYDVRIRHRNSLGVRGAYSATATSSAIVGDTTAPGACGSIVYTAGSASGYKEAPTFSSLGMNFSCLITWGSPSDKDVAKYEWVVTSTDTDAAATAAADPVGPWVAGAHNNLTTERRLIYSVAILGVAGYFRVRAIDFSGNIGPWSGGGTDLQTVLAKPMTSTAIVPLAYPTGGSKYAKVRKIISGSAASVADLDMFGPHEFNVRDYGALGDGSTNDATAINAAIADLNSAGGGCLYFPQGDYKHTSTLTTITVRAAVLGDGVGATIIRASGSGVSSLKQDASGSSVRLPFAVSGITFIQATNSTGTGIHIKSSTSTTALEMCFILDRLQFTGYDTAIKCEGVALNRVQTARITDVQIYGYSSGVGTYGIKIESCTGISMKGVTGQWLTYGVHISGDSEGCAIADFAFAAVTHGVYVVGDGATADGNTWILDGHIAASTCCITLGASGNTANESFVRNVYGLATGASTTFMEVRGDHNTVENNLCLSTGTRYAYGIRLLSGDGNRISGGILRNITNTAIELASGTTNNLASGIAFNDVIGATAVLDSGTGNTVRDCYSQGSNTDQKWIYKRVANTWNPGTVNAGSKASTTFTYYGARYGMPVSIGAPYDMKECALTAFVYAADTVEIVITNNTGSNQTFGSGTYYAHVDFGT